MNPAEKTLAQCLETPIPSMTSEELDRVRILAEAYLPKDCAVNVVIRNEYFLRETCPLRETKVRK